MRELEHVVVNTVGPLVATEETKETAITAQGTIDLSDAAENAAAQVALVLNEAIALARQAAGDARAAAELAEAPTDQAVRTLLEGLDTAARASLRAAVSIDMRANGTPVFDALEANFVRLPATTDPDGYVARVGKKLAIPTPAPATNDGSVTHPSVVYAPGGWNGYAYWMAYTPYEGGNDAYEDPCLVASHDGTNWVAPAGLTNPLDDAPGGSTYNSDTCLVLDGDTMHIIWRLYDTTAAGAEEKLFARSSTDGTTWTPKTAILTNNHRTHRILSPALVKHEGLWHMWGVDAVAEPTRLVRLTAPEITGPWSEPVPCTIAPLRSGKKPWHVSVKRVGSQFVGLLNDTDLGKNGGINSALLLIASSDGINWTASSASVIPTSGPGYTSLYQATLLPSIEGDSYGFDVWYSARSPWRIFRTRLTARPNGTPYAAASGSVFLGSVEGNGGTKAVDIVFPAGLFTAPPVVTVSASNGRINCGWDFPTKDGFKANAYNWTTGAAGSIHVAWHAAQINP